MKISKKTQYGLRALIFLAKNKDKVFSLSEISQKEKIPKDFLEKILSLLSRAKILKTKKGKRGGYFFSLEPTKISLLKIIETLEGKLGFVECLQSCCSLSPRCKAKKFWRKFQLSVKKTLSSLTLKDLIE